MSGFSDPIVAGDRLVRNAIESDGFVAGVSGWRIERAGDAFFNTVTSRGTWRVQNAASGAAYMEGGILGNIPYLKWNTVVGLSPVSATAQMVNTSSLGRLRIAVDPLANNAALTLADSLGILLETSSARALLFDRLDGFLKLGTFAPWVADGWIAAVPQGAWTGTVEYKLLPTGEVIWRGSLSGGATAVGTALVAAPAAAFRPLVTCRFESPTGSTGTSGLIQVSTAGSVMIARVPSAASVYFDGVRYSTI